MCGLVSSKLDDEVSYKILKLLEENPNISQRELAGKMGISLGKVNYCLKALVHVGLVKVGNFMRSKNKVGYAYILTTKGIAEKARITKRFLEQKVSQYESLRKEIAILEREVGKMAETTEK